MDFDLDAFMFEVTTALEPSPAPPQTTPSPPAHITTNGGTLDLEVEDSSKVELASSRVKRRRLSNNPHAAAKKASQNVQSMGIPSFFHPSLDMTTALKSHCPRIPPKIPYETLDSIDTGTFHDMLAPTERLDLVPNFYAYSVKSCLLPIRKVQDELITHYFCHVHPMFPLVDEYRFSKLHQRYRGQEELMNAADFMVYHAIMVAGFAHLSEAQVRNTPYRSVPEGQEAQVDQLKARYWSQSTSDPITLTQVCLILTLWSPGRIGFQNNSYWLDMAFKHATAGRIWEPQSRKDNPHSRSKMLWWCCLIRDRVLALGMRRPHRLHQAPVENSAPSESDFGMEAISPSYFDAKIKHITMTAFIWFCKLSTIMEEMAVIQRKNKFTKDWGGIGVDDMVQGLQEANRTHAKLISWLKEFEGTLADILNFEVNQKVPISVSSLRIIAHSLRATVYQPYLHLPEDHQALIEARVDPLKIMKDAAREAATSARDVIASKKSDAIPTWLVSWITLPVAVYHVNQRIQSNSTPDKVLMPLLAQLVRRSSGAFDMLVTVRNATKIHIEKISSEEDGSSNGPGKGLTFVHSTFSKTSVSRSKEATLLAFVTRDIDSALELNGSGRETAHDFS